MSTESADGSGPPLRRPLVGDVRSTGISRDMNTRSRSASSRESRADAPGEDAHAHRALPWSEIVEQCSEGLIVVGQDQRILYANASACHMLGRTDEELAGHLISDFLPCKSADALRATLEAREPIEIRTPQLHGQHHWLECRMAASLSRDTYLLTLREITELKQLESQLRQSQKLESLGRLAGGVAHDINNMLTVVRGYSELMLRRMSGDHPLRRHANGILDAVDRSSMITQQLLAFSREHVAEPRPMHVNVAVQSMAKLMEKLIGEDIKLELRLSPDVGEILADPGQFGQILLNLCVNSRDAMPTGGRVSISTENVSIRTVKHCTHLTPAPGEYVLITVSDTGCGIPPCALERIFEPFFTTKEQGKGTGLGLATVYGIVRQSRGGLDVRTETGVGTTFGIYLPQLAAKPAPLPNAKATVLLIADEEAWQDEIRQFFSSHKITFINVADIRAALRLPPQVLEHTRVVIGDVLEGDNAVRELDELKRQCRTDHMLLLSTVQSEVGTPPGWECKAINPSLDVNEVLKIIREWASSRNSK